MKKLSGASLLIILILTGCGKSKTISVDSVKTENGTISGVVGTDPEVLVFKGIPFAAPPLGDLRWREPQPLANWEGTKKCDTFGPNAMQSKPVPRSVYTAEFLIP